MVLYHPLPHTCIRNIGDDEYAVLRDRDERQVMITKQYAVLPTRPRAQMDLLARPETPTIGSW